MFHPLRPQRERTAIPHHSRLGERHTHFNLVLSSPPQAQTLSHKIIIFISLSKPWTLGSSEDADFFYGREKNKNKNPSSRASLACLFMRAHFACISFGGSSNGDSRDGAEGVAAMTGGLSAGWLQ